MQLGSLRGSKPGTLKRLARSRKKKKEEMTGILYEDGRLIKRSVNVTAGIRPGDFSLIRDLSSDRKDPRARRVASQGTIESSAGLA